MKSDSEIIPNVTLDKLEQLAKEIIAIKKDLRLGTSSLTPLNYKEEMEKFFSSSSYNPKYIYKEHNLPDIQKKVDNLKIEIDKLILPDDLKEYVLDFLDDQQKLFLTKASLGKKDFSKYAHDLFDWGTDRLDLLLAGTPDVKFKLHIKHRLQKSEKIKERFEENLTRYNINSFKVEIDSFSPHIINVGFKKIGIGSEIRRFECNVDRLIVHEIESHVLQSENVMNSPTLLSHLSNYGSQNLYGEGLAIYNEITTRKITPSAFEIYYYRIKAVKMLDKSFREIFESLVETLGPNRAFVMTYRVKRGLADTSAPGGFPKDAAYLLGFHEIENLVADKFPRKLLYATKSPVLSTLLNKYGLLDLKNLKTPKFQR